MLLALFASALLAAGPLAAIANAEGSLGGSSLTEQAESQSQKSTTTSKSASESGKESTTESSNSSSIILLGTIVSIVLLVGIGFVIVRDARRRAPVTDAELDAAEARVKHDRSAQLKRRRAKSRAAKQQRKKNR
jgi:uncharacterized protein HemX